MPRSSKTNWWDRIREILYTEDELWTDVVGTVVLVLWFAVIWVGLELYFGTGPVPQ